MAIKIILEHYLSLYYYIGCYMGYCFCCLLYVNLLLLVSGYGSIVIISNFEHCYNYFYFLYYYDNYYYLIAADHNNIYIFIFIDSNN